MLDHLEHPYTLVDIGNVADQDQSQFAGNPLMSVPVLEHNETVIYGSDHISAYLVRKLDPEDRFQVDIDDWERLNARSVLNGAMAAEVKLVLAERAGIDMTDMAFFEKARKSILNAIQWCESKSELLENASLTYLQFHFISFWDHAHLYKLIDREWPILERIAKNISLSEIVSRSAPSL